MFNGRILRLRTKAGLEKHNYVVGVKLSFTSFTPYTFLVAERVHQQSREI